MRIFFVGFPSVGKIQEMLYDQEVFSLTTSSEVDNVDLSQVRDGVVVVNLTSSCTIRGMSIEKLTDRLKKQVGLRSIIIMDGNCESFYLQNSRVECTSSENAEKAALRIILEIKNGLEEFVGNTFEAKSLRCRVLNYAFEDGNVLILGETGTGKTLLAEIIHKISPRRSKRIVKLNCATIPDSLMESELFGHAKGSFTGAETRKIGMIEKANGGHMFLDEIAELSPDIQAKLLYVVDQGIYYPVGDPNLRKADVKFISATNRDPKMIRTDLFFRLAENVLRIPPLRQRKADIPLIVDNYFKSRGLKVHFDELKESERRELLEYDYPGNVRELENILREYIRSGKIEISFKVKKYFSFHGSDGNFDERLENSIFDHVSSMVSFMVQNDKIPKLSEFKKRVVEEVEKQYVKRVLEIYKWNKKQVSKKFGITARYLNKLIFKYALDKRTKSPSFPRQKTEKEQMYGTFKN